MEEHRHRHVVRQVRDERDRLAWHILHLERVGDDHVELRARRVLGNRLRQASRETFVDLDGRDARARLEEAKRERTEARPHLEDVLTLLDLRRLHDAPHRAGVVHEVLAELLRRLQVELLRQIANLGWAEQMHVNHVAPPAMLRAARPRTGRTARACSARAAPQARRPRRRVRRP